MERAYRWRWLAVVVAGWAAAVARPAAADSAAPEQAAQDGQRSERILRRVLDANPAFQKNLASARSKDDPVSVAQRTHLRRVAQLRRLAEIAKQVGDAAMAARVRDLERREYARYRRQVSALRTGGKGKR